MIRHEELIISEVTCATCMRAFTLKEDPNKKWISILCECKCVLYYIDGFVTEKSKRDYQYRKVKQWDTKKSAGSSE